MCFTLIAVSLFAQLAAEEGATGSLESVRAEYRSDAAKYQFSADAAHREPLTLITKPVFSWTSLNDYSGDVFVWTKDGLPGVIGCMLSGPNKMNGRTMSHEFHLVGEEPIAAIDLASGQRWEPAAGVTRRLVPDSPPAAATAARRLAQLRQISRDFAVHMQAINGNWELRLLPQPLLRYGGESREVIDGALLAYVWTTGTDPELLLLLECRQTPVGPRWHYSPLRFTLRALRLEYKGHEMWNEPPHQEPPKPSKLLYTTGFVRAFDVMNPQPKLPSR